MKLLFFQPTTLMDYITNHGINKALMRYVDQSKSFHAFKSGMIIVTIYDTEQYNNFSHNCSVTISQSHHTAIPSSFQAVQLPSSNIHYNTTRILYYSVLKCYPDIYKQLELHYLPITKVETYVYSA